MAGPSLPARLFDRGTRVTITGTATIVDPAALQLTTSRSDLGGPQTAHLQTMLLAGDPAGVDDLPALGSVGRAQTWSASLPLGRWRSWDLGPAARRLAQVRQQVDAAADSFSFTAPEAIIGAARARSSEAPVRLRAAAAVGLASLVAFLVLAAMPMRLGLMAESRRLARNGASAPQRGVVAAVEGAVPVLAGLIVGIPIALGIVLLRARASGAPSGPVLSAVSGGLLRDGAIVGGAAWGLVMIAASVRARTLRVLAGAALIGVAAALVGMLSLGRSGAEGGGRLPVALIPLGAAAIGLTIALVLPTLLRALARSRLASRPVAGIAVVELAREPAVACVTAAAIATAVGVAGFSAAYGQTVHASQAEQAAQRVPLDAVVSSGRSLAPPLRELPAGRWSRLTGASLVAPVLRENVSAFAGPSRTDAAMVGVPANVLRSSGAGLPRLAAGEWARPLGGVRIPPAAARLAVRARTGGDAVALTAYVRDPDGYAATAIALGTVGGRTRGLTAKVPPRARGGTLDSLVLTRPLGQTVTATHQFAEGGGGADATRGTLRLDRLELGGRTQSLRGWRGRGGVTGPVRSLRFSLDGSRPAVVRQPRPSDTGALPVLAGAGLAADARISRGLTVEVGGVRLQARVAGIVGRFPTVAGRRPVLVADARALISALDAAHPGAAQVSQLWVATSDPGRLEGVAHRHALTVESHGAVLRRLRDEPVSGEVVRVTLLTALLAIVLGAAGLAISARSQRSDSSHALVDLEAQGVGPRALRASLRMRATLVALLAATAGAACALLLDAGIARAALSAFGRNPDPPIAGVVPVGATLGIAAIVAAVAIGAASMALAGAFRAAAPRAGLAEDAS